MSERFAVSPFGGSGLVRAQFAVNERILRARRDRKSPEGALTAVNGTARPKDEEGPDKWTLMRDITQARAALALSNRTIIVLEALVSFLPQRTLSLGRSLIVFPSNAELSLRTRGMAPATLRRHLAALVEAELILRRDSANGKRFACRDAEGRIATAFGFDLSPLAARASEIARLAAETRRNAEETRALRSEITIHLRDMAAMLATAEEEGRGEAFAPFRAALDALSGRLGRNTDLQTLRARRGRLVALRGRLETAWLGRGKDEPEPALTAVNASSDQPDLLPESKKMSANDAQNERQIEDSDSEDSFRIKKNEIEPADTTPCSFPASVDSCQQPDTPAHPAADRPQTPCGLPLASVLAACPRMADYASGAIRSWHDLARTADLVRTMLGISGPLWRQARRTIGEANAAVVIAAMLERAEALRSPAAYLCDLAQRAEKGAFSPRPMLNALIEARLRKARSERLAGAAVAPCGG